MADRPIEQQTLREQCTHADKLLKELSDHLEHNFLPRIYGLKKVVQSELKGESVVEDLTVRNQAANVLESARFAEEIGHRMTAYFTSISKAVKHIIGPQ